METLLFEKEIIFDIDDPKVLLERQMSIINSLEILGFSKYEIKKFNQYMTNTPTWKVLVYK